jgi:hypothetical protein
MNLDNLDHSCLSPFEQFVTNLLAQGFFFSFWETTNMAQIGFYSNVDVAIIFFLPMNALVTMIF